MPTLYQGYVFMAILYYGMIYGIILQIRNIIAVLIKNKIMIFLIDFIFALLGGIIFWYAIYKSNLGIFRLFLLIVYIVGTILINFCIGQPIEKLSKKMYNKLYEKIKNKNEKKLIKLGITAIFVLVCTVLIYQYSVLYGLRNENQQLCKSVNNLDNRIRETREKIEEYKSIMEDSNMLNDYGEHNGYYNTDEVYDVTK